MKWPTAGPLGWFTFLVNRPTLRNILRRTGSLLSPAQASDIVDVVYLNWLVPRERVAGMLPGPLRLDCFDDRTFVTVLTYRHRHFGPRFLGPLRRLMPSPSQSNWRLYVEPEAADQPRDAIYFIKTVLDHGPYVYGSRLLSDGLRPHRPLSLRHERAGDWIVTQIDPGDGSAPDLESEVQCGESRDLPADLERHFSSWDAAVQYLVEQNRAVRVVEGINRVHESRISIPIALDAVLPAAVVGDVQSRFLADIVAGCAPFAFVVPTVPFRTLGEGWTATF